MSKYRTTSVIRRIKYTLIDEIKENFRLYLVYFVLLILSIVLGVTWGTRLSNDVIGVQIINYLDGYASGECGVLSHFFDMLLTYLLIIGLVILGLRYRFLCWLTWAFVVFVVAKGVRDGVYIIMLGGISNILCGVLFYIIYRIICSIVLSFLLVYIILATKDCRLCLNKNTLIKVGVYFGVGLIVCLAYSILISIIFSVIVV